MFVLGYQGRFLQKNLSLDPPLVKTGYRRKTVSISLGKLDNKDFEKEVMKFIKLPAFKSVKMST
jgi:hypothetical protein